MYNNPYGQNPYQQPNPYQQQPQPQPNPYQPNPYQVPGGMPMAPAGGAPKKSKAPLFIIIAVVALVIIGAVAAVVLLSNSGDKKKEDDTSKKDEATDPEKGPEVPKPSENTGSDAPTVSFNGYTFKSATNYGDNVRQFAKMGTLYFYTDDGYKPLPDINSYLKQNYTHDVEYDEEQPYLTLSKDINDYDAGEIVIYSSFVSEDGELTKRYEELDTFVVVRCGKEGSITVGDKSFQCLKSKLSDVKAAFPKGVEDDTNFITSYGNNFEVDYLFNGTNDTLDTIMIHHFEPADHYENDKV